MAVSKHLKKSTDKNGHAISRWTNTTQQPDIDLTQRHLFEVTSAAQGRRTRSLAQEPVDLPGPRIDLSALELREGVLVCADRLLMLGQVPAEHTAAMTMGALRAQLDILDYTREQAAEHYHLSADEVFSKRRQALLVQAQLQEFAAA